MVAVPELGLTEATVGASMAIPLRETVCVALSELPELSVMVKVALRPPMAAGLKVTEMAQFPPAATAPQLLFAVKSVGLAPLRATLLTDKAAVPELLTVTVCAALLEPTS